MTSVTDVDVNDNQKWHKYLLDRLHRVHQVAKDEYEEMHQKYFKEIETDSELQCITTNKNDPEKLTQDKHASMTANESKCFRDQLQKYPRWSSLDFADYLYRHCPVSREFDFTSMLLIIEIYFSMAAPQDTVHHLYSLTKLMFKLRTDKKTGGTHECWLPTAYKAVMTYINGVLMYDVTTDKKPMFLSRLSTEEQDMVSFKHTHVAKWQPQANDRKRAFIPATPTDPNKRMEDGQPVFPSLLFQKLTAKRWKQWIISHKLDWFDTELEALYDSLDRALAKLKFGRAPQRSRVIKYVRKILDQLRTSQDGPISKIKKANTDNSADEAREDNSADDAGDIVQIDLNCEDFKSALYEETLKISTDVADEVYEQWYRIFMDSIVDFLFGTKGMLIHFLLVSIYYTLFDYYIGCNRYHCRFKERIQECTKRQRFD